MISRALHTYVHISKNTADILTHRTNPKKRTSTHHDRLTDPLNKTNTPPKTGGDRPLRLPALLCQAARVGGHASGQGGRRLLAGLFEQAWLCMPLLTRIYGGGRHKSPTTHAHTTKSQLYESWDAWAGPWVCRRFVSLRSVFVKFGQYVGGRSDTVPPAWAAALSLLQVGGGRGECENLCLGLRFWLRADGP